MFAVPCPGGWLSIAISWTTTARSHFRGEFHDGFDLHKHKTAPAAVLMSALRCWCLQWLDTAERRASYLLTVPALSEARVEHPLKKAGATIWLILGFACFRRHLLFKSTNLIGCIFARHILNNHAVLPPERASNG